MKIIKDRQIIEDNWTHLSDQDQAGPGNITVSLTRWKNDKKELSQHQGDIGIRLSTADKVEDIANDLQQFNLIALEFSAFTDGRSFSQAKLLRSRYQFDREIRAIGNFIPDQVFYLSRVGVNGFELDNPETLNTAISTMEDFTVSYQT